MEQRLVKKTNMTAIRCPLLRPPVNGYVRGSNSYGDVTNFTCDPGYNLVGASSLTSVQCPFLPRPTNGFVSGSNSYGDVTNFTCDPGYNLVGAPSLTCLRDGTWRGQPPTCAACDTFSTDTQYRYRWNLPRLTGDRFEFEVKATNDVHVALSSQRHDLANMYEIVIGGWGNTHSVIRRSKQGTHHATASTPDINSPTEYRKFWITWSSDGTIAVGRGGETEPFMQWKDPDPLPIIYAGYSTGWWSTGLWRFCHNTDKPQRNGSCKVGYRLVFGTCILLSLEEMSYAAAKKACRKDGASLAMPKTEDLDVALRNLVKTVGENREHWIGMKRLHTRSWQWEDGTDLGNYQAWCPGEPSNRGWIFNMNKFCVQYWSGCTESIMWDDTECYRSKQFICQASPN
ncbi:uncharacterized protein LOC118424886 [Branchiostoma floridae]|uniref:Uncharacterized protein LOC118424886 n=1 Tax=Branchiostoma floridae TaxID=7739 RepID=A0A9J7N4B4_BRAFL|nr:uncharacterized protein LOC118424886 [Branchiostoma floridae]